MHNSNQSDADSVADLARLGQLLSDHRPRLLAMVRRRLDPRLAARVDADDVLSEVFLVARRRWSRHRDASDDLIYAWLYRLAYQCLVDAWRREACQSRDLRESMPWPEQSSMQVVLGLVNSGSGPGDALLRDELRQSVRAALESLSESDREILRMRHEDGLTHVQAGVVLQITANAATVRYVRALQRLRDAWTNACCDDRSGAEPR